MVLSFSAKKFKVAIPGEGHETIGKKEETDRGQCAHDVKL